MRDHAQLCAVRGFVLRSAGSAACDPARHGPAADRRRCGTRRGCGGPGFML